MGMRIHYTKTKNQKMFYYFTNILLSVSLMLYVGQLFFFHICILLFLLQMIDLILNQLYPRKKMFLTQIFNACLRAWALYYMLSKPIKLFGPLMLSQETPDSAPSICHVGAAAKAIATRKKAKANKPS